MSERTLHLEIKIGESIVIGQARVRLESKSGQRARLSITAPSGLRIDAERLPSAIDAAKHGVNLDRSNKNTQ